MMGSEAQIVKLAELRVVISQTIECILGSCRSASANHHKDQLPEHSKLIGTLSEPLYTGKLIFANGSSRPIKIDSVMQGVPLKKSLSVSFKSLGTYIQTGHRQDPEEYATELKRLDDMRQTAINSVPSTDGLARLAEYYGQLSRLPSRFPLGEDGIKIAFSWFNFAGKEKKPGTFVIEFLQCLVASHELKFEEACILFNIGATYSYLAAQESYGSVDGLKCACNFFLNAAGAFEMAGRCASMAQISSGTDFCDSSISCLVNLMLAQAQECFVQKAILDKSVKDTTLAKLAMSTATFFESAKMLAGKNNGLFSNWVDWTAGKVALYRGMAHYRKSTEFLTSLQYGKEIVKLQEADETIKDAKDLMKRLPTDLNGQIVALSVAITKNLERAQKDNSFIYNDPIPARGAWGDCGTAIVVRAAAFPETSIAAYTTEPFLFERLPVIQISKLLNVLVETRDRLIMENVSRLDVSVTTLEGAFTQHKLPGVVHSMLSPEGLPETLITQSEEIKAKGGFSILEEGREKVQIPHQECLNHLNLITSTLDDEEARDNNCRQRYGPKWTRALSSQLNVMLRNRLVELQKLMQQGEAADAKVQELFNAHIPSIISLSLSREELEDAVPASSTRNLGIPPGLVTEITAALGRKDDLISIKDQILQELQASFESVDIVSRAIELEGQPDSNVLDIITSELNTASLSNVPKIEQFEAELEEYLRLLERIMADFYGSCSKVQASMDERGAAFQRLNAAYHEYSAILSQFNAGQQFYTNLLEQIRSLAQVCSDFARNRITELEEMTK